MDITFSVLVMLFAKDNEMKRIMMAMEIINDEVRRILHINAKQEGEGA